MNKNLWQNVLRLEKEFDRRGEKLSRIKLQEALNVPQAEAQHVIWALDNRDTIKIEPDRFKVNKGRVLVIADVHIPYHDKLCVEAALDYGARRKVNAIVLLGDVLDFYQISRFVKNPKNKSIGEEIKQTREFLTELRKRFPKAQIFYKEGNHEKRFNDYIYQNAAALSDLTEDLLISKLGLRELNIRYMSEYFRIGKLWYLHGHEKPGGSYNPEYITNVMWKYIHDHFIVGHFHRNQEKIFKNISNDKFWTGAVGYMARPDGLEYAKLNNWNQGFCEIEYGERGIFRASLKTVDNGEIY